MATTFSSTLLRLKWKTGNEWRIQQRKMATSNSKITRIVRGILIDV